MNKRHMRKMFHGSREESLGIEVTTRCNSACSHCFAHAGIPEPSTLSFELAKEIVTEGYNAAYRYLHITGGEPLLWEGLFELLDYAFDLGFETVLVNTNGTMLTDEVNGRFASYEGLSISVSLDGPQAFHDQIRGEGSYRRVIDCIDRAFDAGMDIFIFTTVRRSLLPGLANFAEETYRRFLNLKCLILIQLIRVCDDNFDLSDELLEPDHFLQMVWVASLLNLCGLKTNILRNPLVGIVSKLLKIPWVPHTHPLYSNGSMFVMANRSIALAHSLRSSFGIYEPGMIRKVLISDAYIEATTLEIKTCRNCHYHELCRDHGMFRPPESALDMHPGVPYCQRVIQRALSGFQGWV